MLAKKRLRGAILGLSFGLLIALCAEAGAAALPARFDVGVGPLLRLWRFLVKTAELVLPAEGVDLEGGYIDPDGHT